MQRLSLRFGRVNNAAGTIAKAFGTSAGKNVVFLHTSKKKKFNACAHRLPSLIILIMENRKRITVARCVGGGMKTKEKNDCEAISRKNAYTLLVPLNRTRRLFTFYTFFIQIQRAFNRTDLENG